MQVACVRGASLRARPWLHCAPMRSCRRLSGAPLARRSFGPRLTAPTARHFHSSTTEDPMDAKGPASDLHDIRIQALMAPQDTFPRRHIGPSPQEAEEMLKALDDPPASLDDFVRQVIPPDVLSNRDMKIGRPEEDRVSESLKNHSYEFSGMSESKVLKQLWKHARKNRAYTSYIGCGYANTHVPEVIKRNVLENPAWYTSYTPYQPEISQGRLESLLNFQTMVSDLTALPIANASVLDEATAAAEAMTLAMNSLPMSRQKQPKKVFLVSEKCHPQTIAVLESRADGFGITLEIGNVLEDDFKRVKELGNDLIGVLVQYPDASGAVEDFRGLSDEVHKLGGTVCVGTDLLALTLLTPPGEFGADVAFGNAQRFGVPLGFGGPHAAFFACTEKHKRKIPGRLIGVSKDRLGGKAYRLALQTREQHIRREKATSNICTAQALLANMNAFYAVYHGPHGLKAIAERVVFYTKIVAEWVQKQGFTVIGSTDTARFDTLWIKCGSKTNAVLERAMDRKMNFRKIDNNTVGITLDETVDEAALARIMKCFSKGNEPTSTLAELDGIPMPSTELPAPFKRSSPYLTHPVFNTHHSETELLRYIHHLQSKDLSLVHSMIPLGSCTMKLNGTAEMVPITWPTFCNIHPFARRDQTQGYADLIDDLSRDLAEITGFAAVSLQPNSGAQGEFAGLRVIKKYHEKRQAADEKKRDICLIPVSAHGTNPASAAMNGMRVVPIKCDSVTGNLDMEDLRAKCEKHSEELAAIMVTYPSTFGVFEPEIKAVCELVHQHGGQVYMDGANMNAQIGLCSPGEIGADVCHLNLHKTFCIPHGGGGPGVGPIGVASHLREFLPGHPIVRTGGKDAIAPISAAPWGSAGILPISWAYIKMMGGAGLTHATKITLLNANYLLARLKPHYPILYTNAQGRCAHEFILDVRGFKETAGVEAIDIAKRLQDYGFHAPTMSWPVANTLMIEPTESESKAELDRFCDALVRIRAEIAEVERGRQPREGNVLRMSPHPMQDLIAAEWDRPYSREQAAYPLEWLREKKFWPSVARLDDAYGDTNLFCTCAPVDSPEDVTGAAAPNPT